jgi:hypothetical protein
MAYEHVRQQLLILHDNSFPMSKQDQGAHTHTANVPYHSDPSQIQDYFKRVYQNITETVEEGSEVALYPPLALLSAYGIGDVIIRWSVSPKQ